jgi:hypothetical protein
MCSNCLQQPSFFTNWSQKNAGTKSLENSWRSSLADFSLIERVANRKREFYTSRLPKVEEIIGIFIQQRRALISF